MHNLQQLLSTRRSVYYIGRDVKVNDEQLVEFVRHAVKHVPSPYNSQSQRAVLLLGKEHDKLWDIVMETLRKIVPAANFARTEEKVNAFKAGYGTVLFFDDTAATNALVEQFPLYKDNFILWAQHANAMLQHTIWLGLADLELGASLQHYNPLIDAEVKATFNLPASWSLIAQMPFGNIVTPADADKEFIDINERFLVRK